MSYKNVSPEEFKELMEREDTVILDVRSPGELREGYIPGYRMMNIMDFNFTNEVEALDRSKTYLVYCRSGNRSENTCHYMSGQGFDHVYNLSGGILMWNIVNGSEKSEI